MEIAIYGLQTETISRSKGGSPAKKAAYILRDKFTDRMGVTHYYTHVKDLLHSEVMTPENAPPDFKNIETLLREMDLAEQRYDARTGRVFRLTLPNDLELSLEDWITLTRQFVQDAFVSLGMCAVIAIHEGRNEDPARNNPHAHVLVTDRPVDSNGFFPKKNRDWNTRSQLVKWRKQWAETQNRFFKARGMEVRVSHESLEVQGIDREPTIPLGRAAMALERKGIQTEYGNRNREIEERRREREEAERLRKERLRHRDRSR